MTLCFIYLLFYFMELSSTSTRCVNLHKDDKIFCFFFSSHTHTETKKELCQTQKKITIVSFGFFSFCSRTVSTLSPISFYICVFECLSVTPENSSPPISLSTQQINQPKFEKKKTKNKIVIYKKR